MLALANPSETSFAKTGMLYMPYKRQRSIVFPHLLLDERTGAVVEAMSCLSVVPSWADQCATVRPAILSSFFWALISLSLT
eukprot:5976081-Amphidinium_carterae.1